MNKPPRGHHALQRRRGQILTQARKLARSGDYLDYTSIMTELQMVEDFEVVRSRFEDAAFRTQLNLLCERARRALKYRQQAAASAHVT